MDIGAKAQNSGQVVMRKPEFLNALTDFVGLFFPEYCRGCSDALVYGEDLICTRCLLNLPRSDYHLEIENPFFNKFRGRIKVDCVIAYLKFVKGSSAQHLLHALKYKNQSEIGVALGRLYGSDLVNAGYKGKFDLIVPVPLHRMKRKRRGYNQSEEFGKGLAGVLGVPCCDDVLFRRIDTQTQTRKSKLNRWNNVSDVFLVKRRDAIQDKKVLLVDDVVTTGATLEACGASLLDAGSSSVSFACIAAAQ